jgi:hypothetical protein
VFVKEGEMDLTRDFSRSRPSLLGMVVATALCAGLVAAASANAANLSEWTAQLPAQDGSSWTDFKVKSKKNQRTKKFNPVAIKKVSVAFLELKCSDQEPTQTSFTWGQLKAGGGLPEQIPVRDRKFSFSHSGGYETGDGPFKFTFTFSGRVPRNGPPTGTLRYTTTFPRLTAPPYDPGPDPENPAPVPPSTWVQARCDSGSLNWTGKRLPPGTL